MPPNILEVMSLWWLFLCEFFKANLLQPHARPGQVQPRLKKEVRFLLLSLCLHKTAWRSILFQYLQSLPKSLLCHSYLYLPCHMLLNRSQNVRGVSAWVTSADFQSSRTRFGHLTVPRSVWGKSYCKRMWNERVMKSKPTFLSCSLQ